MRKIVFLLVTTAVLLAGCSRVTKVPARIKEYAGGTDKLVRIRRLENDLVKEVYLAKDVQGSPALMLQMVEIKGFNDDIAFLVVIDCKKEILSEVSILSHQESENYGAYAAEDWFLARFQVKDVNTDLRIVKIAAQHPEDIVAVTGATVTSQAIVDGVNAAFQVFRAFREGEQK